MSNKVQRFIESERELSQLKHWLKTTYRISIEEFVVLTRSMQTLKLVVKSYETHISRCYGILVKLM